MLKGKCCRHHTYYHTYTYICICVQIYRDIGVIGYVVVVVLVVELLLHVTHFRTEFYDANRNVYGVDAFAACRSLHKQRRTNDNASEEVVDNTQSVGMCVYVNQL